MSGCLGHATFDTERQAEHVAKGLTEEFGTVWVVVTHDEHFHAIDTGRVPA